MFQNFHQLTDYLKNELRWDLQHYDFEDLVYDWTPGELGVKIEYLEKLRAIHQLRAIYPQQPWTVFFVEFDSKRLSNSLIRDVLQSLISVRRSADAASRCRFAASEILFLTRFGGKADPQFGLVWFKTDPATNRTVSHYLSAATSDPEPRKQRVRELLQTHLQWPDDPKDSEAWSKQWQSIFSEEIETPEVLRDMEESIINGYLRQTNSQTDIPEKHVRLLIGRMRSHQEEMEDCLIALNEAWPLHSSIIQRIRKKPIEYRHLIDNRKVDSLESYFRSLEQLLIELKTTSDAYQQASTSGTRDEELMNLISNHRAACRRLSVKWQAIWEYVTGDHMREIISGKKPPAVAEPASHARLKVLIGQYRTLENVVVMGCHDWIAEIASQQPEVVGLELNDLISEGMVGLLKAIEGYDCQKSTAFRLYAYRRVRNPIDEAVKGFRYFVNVPSSAGEDELFKNLKERFVTGSGAISAKISQYFEDHEVPEDKRKIWIARLRVLIGDHIEFYGKPTSMEKIFTENATAVPGFSTGLELAELTARISAILDTLTEREREVLEMRFGLGVHGGYSRTLCEVARHFQIERERVRQIEAKALRKLRHPTRIRKLEGFIELP
jgi:RNA polymerase sigma factor (sigma-70 family)